MKRKCLGMLAIAAVAFAVAALMGVSKLGVSNAYACDWNAGCGYANPHSFITGIGTKTQFGPNMVSELMTTTYTGPSMGIQFVTTTGSGSWITRIDALYNTETLVYPLGGSSSDKVGCLNNTSSIQWINCRHRDYS